MRLLPLAFAVFAVGGFAATAPKEVTFNKQVLPLLQKHCQECHRPGEAAPMSLLTYKDARPWAKAIKTAVLSKKMPPWFADAAHGTFLNDRRLSQQEIDILSNWVDSGAKEGDPKDAPTPLTFAEGWTIGEPDLVVEMPNDIDVPATGTIDYTYVVVPTGLTEDKWVEKVEVRPGDRSVVHHAVLFARAPGSNFFKGAKYGVPVVPPPDKQYKGPATDKGVFYMLGNSSVEMVGVYVPGGVAYETRPGQARRLKAGSDIVFQMHYTTNGKPAKDRTRIGFRFAKEPPAERVINTFVGNFTLVIPPNDANAKVVARVPVYEDVMLQSMFPHMHVRGKSMEYRAIYPTGETETLLDVPSYDFNWQLTYYLKEPKKLPKGTTVEIIAHYDNSANNPANPDPTSEVRWGEQTWHEMLAAFVDFAIPVDMDPIRIARPAKPAPSGTGPGVQ